MARPKKQHMMQVALGPPVPMVPIGDFDKARVSEEHWQGIWRIVGPSVERNMCGMRPLPLWKVIASAYMEGLLHGHGIAKDDTEDAA